jgi:hypothetical protein
MTRTATGLFDSYDHAAEAVRSLETAGIPHSDISIVSNPADHRATVPSETTENAIEGAGTGAALGTALGGGAGLLAGLGVVVIPGLGPLVAAGWLASTLVAAGAGAATGGIIGAFTGAGISEDDAQIYAEGVRRGGTIVSARVADSQYETAQSILTRAKAVDVAARARAYRESGWSRFDETASQYTAEEIARERVRHRGAAPTSSHRLIESDRVEGTAVYDASGKRIGSIDRMMIEKVSGRVAYVVISFGGFLGMGDETHPIPWDALKYDTDLGAYRTSITEEQVRGAPNFYRDENYDWSDRSRERELHDYYGARYYWGTLDV